MLRPLFETEDNVNGVILEGGTASNVIPGFSKSEFCIRAATMKRIDELQNMIIGCAKRAESLTGAKVQIQSEPIYAERYPCLPICEDFKENMARVGISMCLPDPKLLFVLLTLEMCLLRSRRSTITCLLQMKRSRTFQRICQSSSRTGCR